MHGTSLLDPFEAFRQGEKHLRRELAVLAPWQLIDVIVAHSLSSVHRLDLNRMSREALTDIIVNGVRAG